MSIHVLHVVWSFGIGGMENGIVNVMNASPASFSFSVIALSTLGESVKRVHRDDIFFTALNKNAGNDLSIIWKLKKIIQERKPDIVYTHGWGTFFEGVMAARLAGTKTIIHGEHEDLETRIFTRRRRIAAYQLFDFFVHKYTAVSPVVRDNLHGTANIESSKIHTIINGVDTRKFKPNPENRKKVRGALGIKEDTFVIVAVGRLVEVKNYAMLIEAAGKVKNRDNIKILLVGDGPLRSELESKITTSDLRSSVEILGQRDDIPQLLAASDLFVSTSTSEGMSNTIMEAMATGLPVIATDVGGTSVLIQHKKNGVLVASNDAAALAEELSNIMKNSDYAKLLGRTSRLECEKNMSLQKMADNYAALFQGCAGSEFTESTCENSDFYQSVS